MLAKAAAALHSAAVTDITFSGTATGAETDGNPVAITLAAAGARSRISLETPAGPKVWVPFPSWRRAINGAAYSLTNPRNAYDLSNTATMYATYCTTGTTCGDGLNTINSVMGELGADINALHFPACAEPK